MERGTIRRSSMERGHVESFFWEDNTMPSRRRLAMVAMVASLCAPFAMLRAQTCNATTPSNAPTCNTTLNAQATVAHLLQLTVNGGAQTTLASPVVTTYDSSAAATSANEYPVGATGPQVTVKANRGWQLTIKASSGYWTFAPDATYQQCRPGGGTYSACTGSSNATAGKLSTDLAWSLNANTAFSGLTTTAATIASNATGSSGGPYTIYYRVKWLYASDVPGTYTLPVVFTITGQ